jgi:hypothetical protein
MGEIGMTARLGRTASARDRIFVNYRREDSAGFAGRLADSLGAWFGPDRVFRDVSGIDYGEDFEAAIDAKMEESGAVVVVIGDRWTSAVNADGQRRLDDPRDYVSREIVVALRNGVAVVPVLIGNATMPRPEELPEALKDLAKRNAITVSDERWGFDVERLAKVLSIDVPGSVAQRRLDRAKWLVLALLVAALSFTVVTFCRAVLAWAPPGGGLIDAGFAPLAAAVPYIALLVAAIVTVTVLPAMAPRERKFGQAAVAVAAAGTLGLFVNYALTNVAQPSTSLVVTFGGGLIVALAMLALVTLAGFRAK